MKNIYIKNELPTGALSLDKVDSIHLEHMLEEGGAEDLIPVLQTYTMGLLLEEKGHMIEAKNLYRESLKYNPKNRWLEEAIERVSVTIQ